MRDQAKIEIGPDRAETPVLRPIELVKLQTRMRRIDLKIERRRLGGFLLLGGQLDKLSVNVSAIRNFNARFAL